MINITDFAEKLKALNIPAFSIEPKQSAFYTEYHVEFRPEITYNKVKARLRDVEMFMDAPTEMTTCGRCIVFKVQNAERETENTFDYFRPEIMQDRPFELPLVIGHSADGSRIYEDLTKFPHLLVGGATGSGKSVFLNNCIVSLIYGGVSGLAMIDVKKVELSIYKDIPNLVAPIATDTKTAKRLLKNLCHEMDARYERLEMASCRNLIEYNSRYNSKIQYITLIVDEIADLVMQDKTIEPLLVRLAQVGRAAGIHMILATQRPDSTVLSGLIRANVPTRVCFAVQKATDSRIILDESGGEKLSGAGDGLFKPIGSQTVTRFQAPYISTEQILKLVNHVKRL